MSSPETCSQCGKLAFTEETVTIPVSEYRELLARPTAQPFMWKPARSVIAKDEELGDYIIELARPGTMLLREIKAACDERFGPARVPSIQALHRFTASPLHPVHGPRRTSASAAAARLMAPARPRMSDDCRQRLS